MKTSIFYGSGETKRVSDYYQKASSGNLIFDSVIAVIDIVKINMDKSKNMSGAAGISDGPFERF